MIRTEKPKRKQCIKWKKIEKKHTNEYANNVYSKNTITLVKKKIRLNRYTQRNENKNDKKKKKK